MPDGTNKRPQHPLLVKGDAYAGKSFIELLIFAMKGVRVTVGRGKVRPSEHKLEAMLENRGFPESVRDEVMRGKRPVSQDQVRQLLTDLYPTPLSRGDPRRLLLKSILDSTWKPDSVSQPTATPVVKIISGPAVERVSSTVEPAALLFEIGDARTGYLWASLLESYRTVRKWFINEYHITKDQIELIAQGELGVPVPVHQVLMFKVTEWLEGDPNSYIPRPYRYLMNLEASEPVKLGKFDLNEIPNRTWFKDH